MQLKGFASKPRFIEVNTMATGAEILLGLLKGGASAAVIAAKMVELFKKNKIQGGAFVAMINHIPPIMIEKMDDYIRTIDELEAQLLKDGYDLSKTANEYREDWNFFERNILPSRLKSYESKIYSIKNEILAIAENCHMIAKCFGQGELIAEALRQTVEARNHLDSIISPNKPLKAALSEARKTAVSVRKAINISGPR